MNIHIHMYTNMYIYTHIYIYMHTCIYVHVYIYINIYTYIFTYVHIHIHVNMYICMKRLLPIPKNLPHNEFLHKSAYTLITNELARRKSEEFRVLHSISELQALASQVICYVRVQNKENQKTFETKSLSAVRPFSPPSVFLSSLFSLFCFLSLSLSLPSTNSFHTTHHTCRRLNASHCACTEP